MRALPFPSTAILATEGQEGPVHVGKRSQSTGWLLTEVHATCNIPPVPAPAVASPTLLKHSFWSETSWSLTTDQFPLPLLPFHVEEGFYWACEALMGSGHILGHCCSSLASIRDQDISRWAACVSALQCMAPAVPLRCRPGPDAPPLPTSQFSASSWQPLLQCRAATQSKQGMCRGG